MKHYLLSVYQPDGPPPEPAILDPIMRDIAAVEQEMKDAILNPSLETAMLPTDWVLLYAVPQDTSGFSLLIRNRSPRKGQPSTASVDLGR